LLRGLHIVKQDTLYDINLKFRIISVSEKFALKASFYSSFLRAFLVINFGTLYLDVLGLNLILPLVLLKCETLFPVTRYKRSLRVFDNRVLRRIFGPKRGEVTGEWRKTTY
jgi:hypothetical protein